MIIGFASSVIHDDWQASKIVQTSKNRIVHYFEVINNLSFSLLIERIIDAYNLTKSTNPRKQREVLPEFKTIEEYINLFNKDTKEILLKVYNVIKQEAPEAEERVSWKMPTFFQKENLIHFAVGKSHLGIYPGAEAIVVFKEQLKAYKTSKGAIQFPFSKPIPYDLIGEIVRYRVKQIED